MIYPEFLQNGSTIGIAAPSAGVGDDIADWEKSMKVLEKEGFEILETASVRNNDQRSADATAILSSSGSRWRRASTAFTERTAPFCV